MARFFNRREFGIKPLIFSAMFGTLIHSLKEAGLWHHKEKLAACVNIVPGIKSIYFWDGKVQNDFEELLIIKTRESLLEALSEHVKANHEYEIPEVITLPITGGNHKYLEWIKSNTRDEWKQVYLAV